MKKFLLLNFFLSTFINPIFSQSEEKTNDCIYSLKNTVRFLSQKDSINPQIEQEINSLLTKCPEKNIFSNYIQAKLIYLEKGNLGLAFSLLKDSASKGHTESMFLIGTIYKEGTGIERNFKSSLEWFRKASDLGHSQAQYSIGYFYLKGLGTEVDYEMAVDNFEKSDFPMAKHWLAVCYLYGYGVERNETIALNLFNENSIFNSKFFINNIDENLLSGDNIFSPEELVIPQAARNDARILGRYSGIYTELDWSGQRIQRIIPLEITLEDKGGNLKYQFTFGEETKRGNFSAEQNWIRIEDLKINIKGLHIDHPSNKNLKYVFNDIKLYDENRKDSKYDIIGIASGEISNWKEPIPPHVIFLNFQPIGAPSKLVAESLKISPNPFTSQFEIFFELVDDALVEIQLYNNVGQRVKSDIVKHEHFKGAYNYEVPANELITGNYIIEIKVDQESISKLIIKK